MSNHFQCFFAVVLIWSLGFYLGYGFDVKVSAQLISKNEREYLFILNSSAWYIFLNNLMLCVLCLIGVLLFSLPTIVYLVYNGFIAGQIIFKSVEVVGYSKTLAISLPHSIEFVSLWLSSAFSFYLTPQYYRLVVKGDSQIITTLKSSKMLFFVIIVLVAIAAFLESYNMYGFG